MRPIPFLFLALSLTTGCFVKPDDTGPTDPVDSGDPQPVDADGDGYDDTVDCDDSDPAVFPGADELCNGIDDDCDEDVDEADAIDATAWLPDADGDGFGDRNTDVAVASCEAVSGHVADASDCDDSDPAVNPDADEICNELDDDCDGEIDVDASDAPTWYLDYDDDGYGGSTYTLEACDAPEGYVADATDCDDLEVYSFPGADEWCDGVDNDCDDEVDEDDAIDAPTWYEDADGDGYGSTTATQACAMPKGFVDDSSDCLDSDAASYPGAAETCDGYDNDCDGTTDEADAVDALPWYEDADGDGYGWFDASATLACTAPSGFVADDTDCDDGDSAVSPASGDCNWATVSDVQTGAVAEGDAVAVVGWVMHDAMSTGFHLADASGAYNGVWVYTLSSTMLEGDEVVLHGTVAEYNELTEIVVDAPSADIILLDSGVTIPAATVLPTADLADLAIAETYEGVLVTVENVDVTDSDLGYGEWSVDDGVRIDDLIYGFEGDLMEGGSFTSITGLLYHSYGDYKILPRYAADLVGYTEPPCAADACAEDLLVGDLVITEFMFNPDFCDDADCEWVELYNASGGSVDLDGLIVQDDGGNTATVNGSPVLASASTIVLAVGDSSTWGYTGFTPDAYYGSTVALGNGGDQVSIANSAGILDTAAAYTGGTSPGSSLSLDPTARDVSSNDDPASWCLATSTITGTSDLGTPGTGNDPCP